MKTKHRNEREFLRHYDPKVFDAPLVTVDMAIFTLHDDQLKVLLVRRGDFPEKGKWALPGGFIDIARDGCLADTAKRKLQEKTGVASPYLEQLATVGNAERDVRGWSVTVVYFALIPHVLPVAPKNGAVAGEGHVESIAWVDATAAMQIKLAFDHADLLQQALERLRNKVLYSLMPAYLIASPFTLTGLQRAYEIIMGREVEKKAFRRRLEHAEVLEETGGMISEGPGRPAMLYRLRSGVEGFSFLRQLAP